VENFIEAREAARALGLRAVEAADDLRGAAGLIRAATASLRDLRTADLGRWHAASREDQEAVAEVTRLLLEEALRLVLEAVEEAS
jgi:hypothetical protein